MNHPAPADDFRILVIDDQPANLELVEQLLAREGLHNVLSCTDPAQALELELEGRLRLRLSHASQIPLAVQLIRQLGPC